MSFPSVISVFQMLARYNLKLVLPKYAARRPIPQFFDRSAEIAQQPGQIACLRNMGSGAVPKPANSADFGLGAGAVEKALRCIEVVIEPVKHTAQFAHLPVAGKVGAVIKQIIGGGEHTCSAARIRVDATRSETDIHEGNPYDVRTFLCLGSEKICCKYPNQWLGGRVSLFERQRKTWDNPMEFRRRAAFSKTAWMSLGSSWQQVHFKRECVA